jgi:small subunit ribosomal protein S1
VKGRVIRRKPGEEEPVAEEVALEAPPRPEPVLAKKAPREELDLEELDALARMDPADFEALYGEDVGTGPASLSSGDLVTGRITRVGDMEVFVDVGARAEGLIERMEFTDPQVGDEIQAMVVAADETGVLLTMQISGDAAQDLLDNAQKAGVPVEGTVTARNKGGYDVTIGEVRAFCPLSQISRMPLSDPESVIGQTLPFKIIRTGDGDTVVSRRAIEEEEVAVQAARFWQVVREGQKLIGTVRNVQPFGTFVDVGGVDGLIPSRELGGEPPQLGDRIEVRVLQFDVREKKVTLSLRSSAQAAERKPSANEHHEGTLGTFADLLKGYKAD